MLSLVAVLVLTRTRVTKAILLPRLESALGLEIRADSVIVASDLSVVFHKVGFIVPGLPGPEGELLSAESITVRVNWDALPSPSAIREITLEHPRLRLSQSRETGEISAASLALFGRVGGDDPASLPTINVRDGVFEMGEHDASGYTTLAEVPFGGVLASQPDDPNNRSFFTLTRQAGVSGFELTGMIDASGLEIRLGGLSLDQWPAESVPSRMRDVWTRLALDGRVVPKLIKISPAGDVQASIGVEHVAMTLPFGAEPARLTDVDGVFLVTKKMISADLTGHVSSLTQHVVFDMWGFDPKSSPLVARLVTEPFRFEQDFELLQFVPPIGHKQNERFGHPEADVEAEVWLARGDRPRSLPAPMTGDLEAPGPIARRSPDTPTGELRVEGVISMSHGRAAFRGFPYPFRDMTGVFRFTQDRLIVESVRGVGPTGARLSARGTISPLGPNAAVDLDLRVESLPVDDVLLSVLSPERRALLESIISRERYRGLLEAGLVSPPERQADLRGTLAALEEEKKAWVAGGISAAEAERIERQIERTKAELDALRAFRLGGEADAIIKITRLEGDVSIWTRRIDLTFETLGLLSRYFPLPTIGRNVRFSIMDGRTSLHVEDGETIGGGRVAIDAEVLLDEPDPRPRVVISADEVPVDDLLIHAVAGPTAGQGREPGPGELGRVLSSLGLSGRLDCDAEIFPADGGVGYRIEARPNGLAATIENAGIEASDIGGRIVVEPASALLDLRGRLRPEGTPLTIEGAVLRAEMTLPEGRAWGDRGGDGPAIEATVSLPGADLRLPAERLIAVFDHDAADRVRALRAKYRPEGVLDVESRLAGRIGPDGVELDNASVVVTGVDHLAFDAGPLRIGASSGRGTATITLADNRAVVFDAFSIDLTADGVPSGRLSIDDTIPLDGSGRPWNATLERGRFESPLTRHAAARPPSAAAPLFDRFDPGGVFDLILYHRPDGAFDGVLSPTRLSLSTPRGKIDFSEAAGRIIFGPAGGRFEGLELGADGLSLRASGRWAPAGNDGDSGTSVELMLSLDADRFDDALLGLAPDEIGRLFESMGIGFDGEVRVRDLRVRAEARPDGSIGLFDASGNADFSAGRLNIGVPITELDGSIVFRARRDEGAAEPSYALTLEADHWRLLGLRMTNGRAEVRSGREPGSVLVPVLEADAHGGRLSGSVRVSRDGTGRQRYLADVQLAEVRLAPLLEDVKVGGDQTLADEVHRELQSLPDPAVWDRSHDRSRGLVSAALTLTGIVGTDEDRRGRGRVIAGGGPVVMLPLLTPLIEFSNLVPPVGDELGLALADFYIEGDTVTFEKIAVFSDRIELLGYGRMTWPGARLDLRVRSRAVDRIPVVSGMLENVRDELLTTRLTGPIGDPTFSLETFAATRRVVGSLLGGDDDGFRDRFREISRSASSVKRRIRAARALLERFSARGDARGTRAVNDAP